MSRAARETAADMKFYILNEIPAALPLHLGSLLLNLTDKQVLAAFKGAYAALATVHGDLSTLDLEALSWRFGYTPPVLRTIEELGKTVEQRMSCLREMTEAEKVQKLEGIAEEAVAMKRDVKEMLRRVRQAREKTGVLLCDGSRMGSEIWDGDA